MLDNTDNADDLLGGMQDASDVQPVGTEKPKGTLEDSDEEEQEEGEEGNDLSPNINKGGEEQEQEEQEASEEDIQETTNTLRDLLVSINSGNASKEDVALGEELLEKFKGHSFDDYGNVLDEKGQIIKSSEDVIKEIAKEEKVTLDDKGNQVDSKGNIIATKEELEIENSVVNNYAKELGYEFLDENQKPKIYAEGAKGIKDLANDIATARTQEFKNDFLNSNPEIREFAKHILAGNDKSTFEVPIDYSTMDTSKMSLEEKQSVIKKSLIAEGVNPERAEKVSLGYKGKDADVAAEESKDILIKKENERQVQRQEELDAKVQQDAIEAKKYWEDIKQVVTKGNLEDFTIPQNDRDSFFQYLAVPVNKEGQSQDQIDRENSSEEKRLKEAYYRFKGYDVNSIVKDSVNKKVVNSLRNRLAKRQELSDNKSTHKGNKKVEVSLENIN